MTESNVRAPLREIAWSRCQRKQGVALRREHRPFELATLPFLVAGLLLLAGNVNGMDWFAAAVVLSLLKVGTDAWVLEINR